jgi:uncharacterized protein (TIGR02147 family)
MTEIYSFTDYRAFLRQTIAAAAESERSWGGITRWATSAGFQRSHGSRVLSGDKDLSAEQALATAEFLKLNEIETDYFLLMVDFAKAGTKPLKDRLQRKLKAIKKEKDSLAAKIHQPHIESRYEESLYYSAWYWSAIHILTSVPGFSTPAKIAAKLRLPLPLVEMTLTQLGEQKLIKKQNGHWSFSSSSIHLPKNSAMISVHHNNWRQRAIADAQDFQSEALHYTVVQSISAADQEKFQAKLVRVIEEFQRLAIPSQPEELVSFCCDFFKL